MLQISHGIDMAMIRIACIGANDGFYIPVVLPVHKEHTYRGRKGEPTNNYMCACDLDMKNSHLLMLDEIRSRNSNFVILDKFNFCRASTLNLDKKDSIETSVEF